MYRLRAYVEGSTIWYYGGPKLASVPKPSENGAIVDEDRSLPGASDDRSSAWAQFHHREERARFQPRNLGSLPAVLGRERQPCAALNLRLQPVARSNFRFAFIAAARTLRGFKAW